MTSTMTKFAATIAAGCFALFVVPVVAQATTFYVATTGSDSNPGTLALPFATIQKGSDRAFAGDTVIVEDGVYTTSNSYFVLVGSGKGGSSGRPVTFKSAHKHGARLNGQNNLTSYAFLFSRNSTGFVNIQDFEIYGMASIGIVTSNSHDMHIVGNHIHDIGRRCSDFLGGFDGIYGNASSANITIERNFLHDIGRFSPGEQGCHPSTHYYQNLDHGIYLNGMNNTVIINNIFYNFFHGWGIQLYPNHITGLIIANNTFSGANPYRDGIITVNATVTNATVANNIFYNQRNFGIRFSTGYGTLTNFLVENNITFPNTISGGVSPAGVTFKGNRDATDPKLSAPSTFDFHLTSTSPAINKGMTMSAVTNDFDANARPFCSVYDIGTYEYVASCP